MPPLALLAPALVAGGSVASGIIQGNAARDAAQKQSDAANAASNLQHQQFEEQRADQQPWRQAGAQALSQLQDPGFQKSFALSDFQQDPGYQFRMQQGQDALQRSAAARGGLNSGAFSQALTQYGQGFASNEYQNAYNRFNNDQTNRFNRLSSLAGLGQTANAQIGQAGQNYANQVGQNMMGAANAQAAAGVAGANAWGNSLSNMGRTGMDMYAMDQQNTWMNKMLSGYGQGSTPSQASAPSQASSGTVMAGDLPSYG